MLTLHQMTTDAQDDLKAEASVPAPDGYSLGDKQTALAGNRDLLPAQSSVSTIEAIVRAQIRQWAIKYL